MASKDSNTVTATVRKTWTKPELKRLGTIADVSAPKTSALLQGNFT